MRKLKINQNVSENFMLNHLRFNVAVVLLGNDMQSILFSKRSTVAFTVQWNGRFESESYWQYFKTSYMCVYGVKVSHTSNSIDVWIFGKIQCDAFLSSFSCLYLHFYFRLTHNTNTGICMAHKNTLFDNGTNNKDILVSL